MQQTALRAAADAEDVRPLVVESCAVACQRWRASSSTFVGSVLAILAYASWSLRPWAWHLTLVVYGIGVVGSLWQVGVGIREGWVAAVFSGAVVVYAAAPGVRRAYGVR